MKMPTMKNFYRALVMATCCIMITACSSDDSTSNNGFVKQVEDYRREDSLEETFTVIHTAPRGRCRKAE